MVLTLGQSFTNYKAIEAIAIQETENDGVSLLVRDSKTTTDQEANEEGYNKDLKYHHAKLLCSRGGQYKPKKGSAAAQGRTPLKNKRLKVSEHLRVKFES